MSVLKRFFLYVLPLVLAPALLLAAPGEIKLATLVPANTSWHKALLDMGNTWNKDTSGRVTLTVYPGGTQGDESTTIKKMRSDILQASFLTAAGLAELDDAFNVFAMPFFFESDEEEMAVEKKLSPLLDQKL
ncbi:MAG: TRAP transporter substrate-binding protein DctP, partial [Acidobacteria bacterium]|nr:TRAP transporter substrate-binding protein DctP [Acidobacteriota bacterium]